MAKRMEVDVPETKPATEWILGRPVRKVSPKRDHAIVQRLIAGSLGAWADGRGEVGTEWKFFVTPPGELTRPLVPDVAYIAYGRLIGMSREQKQEPRVTPNVVVEVRSPSDRQTLIDEKLRVYLQAGAEVVILVDPQNEVVLVHDKQGVQRLSVGDRLEHAALPEFELDVTELFAKLR